MNSNERERVERIRERLRLNGYTPTSKEDVRLLLFLYDQQTSTTVAVLGGLKRSTKDITGYHGGSHFDALVDAAEKRNAVLDEAIAALAAPPIPDAATRMRDKCAAKVRAMREDWKIEADARRDPDNPHDYKGSYGLASGAVDACDDIITALESLTLDQGEQKQ